MVDRLIELRCDPKIGQVGIANKRLPAEIVRCQDAERGGLTFVVGGLCVWRVPRARLS